MRHSVIFIVIFFALVCIGAVAYHQSADNFFDVKASNLMQALIVLGSAWFIGKELNRVRTRDEAKLKLMLELIEEYKSKVASTYSRFLELTTLEDVDGMKRLTGSLGDLGRAFTDLMDAIKALSIPVAADFRQELQSMHIQIRKAVSDKSYDVSKRKDPEQLEQIRNNAKQAYDTLQKQLLKLRITTLCK